MADTGSTGNQNCTVGKASASNAQGSGVDPIKVVQVSGLLGAQHQKGRAKNDHYGDVFLEKRDVEESRAIKYKLKETVSQSTLHN